MVEVRFEAVSGGTLVTVEHGGWEGVGSAAPGLAEGYGQGWAELLGFYRKAVPS